MRMSGLPFLNSRMGASLCVFIVLIAVILVAVLMMHFGGTAGH